MNCPLCGTKTVKGKPSEYWCWVCRKWWLIQNLPSRPPRVVDPPKEVNQNE